MIATPVPSAPPGNNSDSKTLNVSSNTSGSSTASSVLIRSTKPPIKTDSSLSSRSAERRLSSSSFSSTNSQRVSIKAKFLKEVKSPFEVDGQTEQINNEYIPPALPGNLPADYEQRRDIADTINRNQSEPNVLGLDNNKENHLPGKGRISTGDGATYKSIRVEQVDSTGEKVAFRTNSKPPSSSSLLKQGAPTSSHSILSHPSGPSNDVRITQFALGGKQKVLKDQLLKRQEQTAPVKRYIRPTMVGSDQRVSSSMHGHPEGNMAAEIKDPTTVAAVTAAAVAATVPIVKAQTDLETKMDTMMEKLVLLQELTNRGQQHTTAEQHTAAVTNSNQGGELQKTLDEVMNKRLQHLEKIQDRQMEWQEKLMSAAYQPRRESHSATSSHSHHTMKSQLDSNHIGPEDKQPLKKKESRRTHPGLSGHAASAARPEGKQAFKDQQRGISHETLEKNAERHKRYTPAVTLHSYPAQQSARKVPNEGVFSSDNDAPLDKTAHQPSPLDTPAPRRHAPRPLTQNGPPKISHAGRGLLEEILTSHDEEEQRLATRGHQIPTPSSRPKTSHNSGTR